MISKITSALKSPLFWVALVAGIILAVAFPKLAGWAKPIASKIPGATPTA